jgi:diguanylate cyclase (GGDEF)-like protein
MRNPTHDLPLLAELSVLLKRSLRLEERRDAGPGRAGAFPQLTITPDDGAPLSDGERKLLEEIAELIQRNNTLRNEFAAIDQRLRMVERENIELSMKNRALAEQSSRDALTGLFTRWYMVDKVEAEMNRALRCGTSVAVLMLDVDHLKQVNERFGTEAGDLVLQNIAQVLRDSCRVYDVPARYGGEEFCVMLPETKLDSTLTVAERLRRKIETTPIVTREGTISVTTSIGIASLESIPDEALLGASSLIERADRALFTAKDHGRNRVETWNGALASRAVLLEH